MCLVFVGGTPRTLRSRAPTSAARAVNESFTGLEERAEVFESLPELKGNFEAIPYGLAMARVPADNRSSLRFNLRGAFHFEMTSLRADTAPTRD
jgi:hypothetical protein